MAERENQSTSGNLDATSIISRAGGSATALHAELVKRRLTIRERGLARLDTWRPAISLAPFLPSATNLANYLALRAHDLRDLQPQLSELGLSSLGRCEADVLSSLDAVIEALARIAGNPPLAFPEPGWKRLHVERHKRLTAEIFGADPTGPRTRIMVTLASLAADDPSTVHDMIAAGADCIRINCAHGDPAVWSTLVVHAREASIALGRDVRILMDLAGPKLRIASAAGPDKLRARRGDLVLLSRTAALPSAHPALAITATHLAPIQLLRTGQKVSIDDGKVSCIVEGTSPDAVALRVVQSRAKGVKLKPEKGLNFPDLELDIPPLTPKDTADLDFVLTHADIVGFSFVQRPEDIAWLQREMAARLADRPLPPLLIKIETRLGVANLPALIVAAAGHQPTGVMIARGDLAAEIGLEELSEAQEQMLWICEAAHIPVVWATQVVDSLVKTGVPSRAEATDAAMGQRAECVMLNKGPYALEAIRFIDGIFRRMDTHVMKKTAVLGSLPGWNR